MRSKDPFWEHVDVVENKRSRCRHCGEVFAPRNIHRIKLHLAGVARGIKKCTGVPAEVREEALKAVSKRKDETPSYSVVLQGKNSLSSNVQYSSPEISQKNDNVMLLRNNNDSKVINQKLAKFFLLNNIPFDVVETSSFIDFVKSVSRCDHGYKLPSHLELQTEFVSEIEMQVEKYVKDVKKSLEKTGCTIMVENCCNFINILVYSPGGAIFEASYEVSVLETMDCDIREIVASIIEKTGVDYVVQFITNDSQIFLSVGEMLEVKYPRIYLIRCVAQEIHFLLKDMFDEIPWIGQIIDHAELILKHMYHNDVVLSLMRQYTKDKELKHPSMSKFASKYQMLHSIFDNKNELQQLIASEEWYKLDSNRNETAAKVTCIIQSENFWSEGRDVLDVLEPIVQVLRLVEDDKSTSGYLYEELKRAREAIERYRDGNPAKYQRILEILEERQGMIIHPIHAAASFLNPTYMFLKDSEYWDINMYNGMNLLSEKLVASGEETANFTRELQLYRKRSKEFTNEMSYQIMNSYHPREWWEHHQPRLPVLSKYAIRILSQPCKCSCNIKPSVSEVARRKLMNSTTSKSLNHMFVTVNSIFMEKFRSMEKQNRMSLIDLETCTELPDYAVDKQDWENDQMDVDAKNETDLLCFGDKTFLQQLEASDWDINTTATLSQMLCNYEECAKDHSHPW